MLTAWEPKPLRRLRRGLDCFKRAKNPRDYQFQERDSLQVEDAIHSCAAPSSSPLVHRRHSELDSHFTNIMSSVGRIQAALAAATNEVTVAAANLNFDFTLIKCEAPQEFHQLGNALTQRRKENAEYGSTHITARRLGALFEGTLPSTPTLLRAYGKRVSEIAQTSRQSSSPEPENSMFAAHAGIDGTSIWAAATSSPTALHVQLLACMLARQWSASEATSIWVELVQERRTEVEEAWNQNHAVPYTSLTAATQSKISRSSLAEWDASARSWLRTADRVKFKHQNQLMLLIANASVPVSDHMRVYQSVIPAWKAALESTEKLMSGMPQAANYGPCLLAISSWHLYPDIIVTGKTTVSHNFDDPLIRPGGTLTLGLARPGGDTFEGVFWSLSLAHLNFYGRRPVPKEAVLNLQTQKLSFQQFTISVFGAFLTHWGTFGANAEAPARFLVKLRDFIHNGPNHECPSLRSNVEYSSIGPNASRLKLANDSAQAINILARAADTFLEAREFEDDLDLKLIALGGKKAERVFSEISTSNFMGLADPKVLLRLLKGPDERITLLRRILGDSDLTAQSQGTFLIRFAGNEMRRFKWDPDLFLGIATAQVRREALPQGGYSNPPHVRWAPRAIIQAKGFHKDVVHEMSDSAASQVASKEFEFTLESNHAGDGVAVPQTYHYIYGDPGCAAIYLNATDIQTIRPGQIRPPTFQDLIWCLEFDLFDMEAIISFFDLSNKSPGLSLARTPEGPTLKALGIAHKVYQSLPTATVSTRALNYPLSFPRWTQEVQKSFKTEPNALSGFDQWTSPKADSQISQAVALSCVAWLEAGVDIDPPDLERVFALAYEDSIYVSMNLTCDPWDAPSDYELKRVTGNVGKPGLTLLIPPDDPVVSENEESSWRVIGTSEFNGLAEDSFSNTSMHLSFTEYYFPLVRASDGQGQDKLVHYLESVVSIHHAGRWIGDVDIQKCLASSLFTREPPESCKQDHGNYSGGNGIRSIESWEDVIDPPPGDAVVRAHGNWVARLATTAVLIRLRKAREGGFKEVSVFPREYCWTCAQQRFQHRSHLTGQSMRYMPGIYNIMIY